ncbi:MAG: DUF308 domain-containing protein [Victivallaceae bacterium]|nr:DUF308 domain-containing protein [Victivallaceae bacterium]
MELDSFGKKFVDYSRGVLLFRGILIVVFGILMFTDFTAIINLVTMILGIVLLVDGGATLIGMFAGRKVSASLIASSLFLIIFGILALKQPFAINTLILVVIGIWLAAGGIQEIVFCFTAKRPFLSILSGILSLLAGALFIISPWSGLAAIGTLLGILLVVSGVTMISTAILLGQKLNS